MWAETGAAYDFRSLDLADRDGMADLFAEGGFDVVINLAAQAGVRYSLENPHAYADANLLGFLNVLEGCRAQQAGAFGFCVFQFGLRHEHQDRSRSPT